MSLVKGFMLGLALLAGSITISLFGGDLIGRAPVANADATAESAAESKNDLQASPGKKPPKRAAEIRVVGFGHVDIEEGTTPLAVPAIGQIAEVLVRDGQSVKAGDPLVRLHAEAAAAQLARAQAAVSEAEVRLAQARRAPENHRLLMERQRQAIAADRSRLDGHRRQVERLEKLNESQAISSENYLSAKDKLQELEAALKADELNLAQLELDKPEDGITLAEVALEAAKAQRIIAQDELNRRTLTAPEDGTILRVLVSKGQSIGPSSPAPAIWFCPNRPRIVRCEIDQEFADQVDVGMLARLYDDRETAKHWTGRVSRTADWIAPRRSMLDEPFQKNDVRTLECIVTIDQPDAAAGTPVQQEPRIGQRLRVELYQPNSPSSPTDRPLGPAVPLSQTGAKP